MTIRNFVSALLGVVAIGASAVGAIQFLDPEPPERASVTLATTGTVGTTTAGDVRGPCDELENRNDPRCTGAAPEDDRSGPGHGDDRDADDRSGPGDGDDDEDRDDRSGSNSGRG